MAYIICEPCIGTKDTACVDVCPVDCIHPRKDEPSFATAEMLSHLFVSAARASLVLTGTLAAAAVLMLPWSLVALARAEGGPAEPPT